MRKLIALALCLMLLLSGCTVAGREMPGTRVQIRDLAVNVNGSSVLDMSGLALTVEPAAAEDSAGVRLSLGGSDPQLAAVLGVVGGQLYLSMESLAEGEHAYAFDISSIARSLGLDLDAVLDALAEQITNSLNGIDGLAGVDPEQLEGMSEEELEDFLSQWSGVLEGEEDAKAQLPSEQQALWDKAQAIVDRCVDKYQEEQDGVVYNVSELRLAQADMAELLDLVTLTGKDGETYTGSEALEQLGMAVVLNATAAFSEDEERFYISYQPIITGPDGVDVQIDLIIDGTGGDDTASVTASVAADGSALADLYLVVAVDENGDGRWLPADADSAVLISDLSDEAALNGLAEDVADFFSQVTGTVTGASLINSLLSALRNAVG